MSKQWPKPPKGWPFSGEGDPAHDSSTLRKPVKPTTREFAKSEAYYVALTRYMQTPEAVQNKPDDRTIDGEWKEV